MATHPTTRPKYDELPLNKEAGKRSCWGMWDGSSGPDHLGSLNNLTQDIKLVATREVTHGQSFQLDWPYEKVGKPAFGRLGLQHKVINYEPITGEMAHDDEISLNTQCGSQWDGFMHYADQKIGCYYNGVRHTDDVALGPEAHGIHHWCKQGIVGRGVLLDWPRWLEATDQEPISPITSHSITVKDLKSIAEYQGLEFYFGDILIIRTGFLDWFESATVSAKADVFANITFSGVQQGEETERWLWDTGFSAVAGDAVSWECYPPPKGGSMLHQWLLPHAGMPIGELWNLESLAKACAKLKKWSFLLTSAPLNVHGGIASPPNAIAIL
ncbi:hypothetical protein EDB80DRAFT_811794 [Ilyonectria destructans]|nr:hypothetical protein EDB80DRAFT_811794 [Ilyonectria destructans]